MALGLPKKTVAKVDELLDLFKVMLQSQMQQRWNSTVGTVTAGPPAELSEEDKAKYDELVAELEPQIKEQAEALVKTEIHDMMVLGGNWSRVKELLKRGQKPRIIRKREGPRDPLFLQFGDGVQDEIEEFRVLG